MARRRRKASSKSLSGLRKLSGIRLGEIPIDEHQSHRKGGPARKRVPAPKPSNRNIEVRRVEEVAGGILVFTVRSYDPVKGLGVGDDGREWHPCYDQETGLAWCDCPRCYYDVDPLVEELGHWSTILTPDYLCKHLRHVLGVLWRSGQVSNSALRWAVWFEQAFGSFPVELAGHGFKASRRGRLPNKLK